MNTKMKQKVIEKSTDYDMIKEALTFVNLCNPTTLLRLENTKSHMNRDSPFMSKCRKMGQ